MSDDSNDGDFDRAKLILLQSLFLEVNACAICIFTSRRVGALNPNPGASIASLLGKIHLALSSRLKILKYRMNNYLVDNRRSKQAWPAC